MNYRLNIIISAVILLATCSCTTPMIPSHNAADGVIVDMMDTIQGVKISYLYDGVLEFAPASPKAGILFYPGALVDYRGYAPLMGKLAQRGFLCLLVQMPSDFAILSLTAKKFPAQYPEITDWYIGGHSLGGAKAAMDINEDFKGVILLGAYSTKDLHCNGWKAISVYGSEDYVLNRDNYQKYLSNLPDDFKELVIPGGCHSYFAVYGHQSGDGTPTITRESQMNQTADFIASNLL